MRPIVSIEKISDTSSFASIKESVGNAVHSSCDFVKLCKGKSVVLKPNVYCPSPPPTTTDPRVIAALCQLANDAGAKEVIVAEGRSISTKLYRKGKETTAACFEATGMTKAALDNGARIVYLEDDEFLTVDNENAQVLTTAHVPKTIYEAETLINVPVMKNHSLTLVTLGIKNLHGTISDEDKLYGHDFDRINAKLVDILHYNRPDLTVMDAVRGQEGDHASLGKPVEVNAIISGTDTVAVDAVCEAVMGLEKLESETLKIANEQGLGVGELDNIEVVGVKIEDVRHVFARPDIEISEERFPNLRIFSGDYCKGCEYYVRRGIDRLVEEGALDGDDKIAVVFGKDPEIDEDYDGKAILLGDCALESHSVKRLRNRLWLEGKLKIVYCCPPMEFRMRALELAGD